MDKKNVSLSVLKGLALEEAGQTKSNRYSKRRQLQILINCGILGIGNEHREENLPRIDSSQELLPKSQLATRGELPQRPTEVCRRSKSHKNINSWIKNPTCSERSPGLGMKWGWINPWSGNFAAFPSDL